MWQINSIELFCPTSTGISFRKCKCGHRMFFYPIIQTQILRVTFTYASFNRNAIVCINLTLQSWSSPEFPFRDLSHKSAFEFSLLERDIHSYGCVFFRAGCSCCTPSRTDTEHLFIWCSDILMNGIGFKNFQAGVLECRSSGTESDSMPVVIYLNKWIEIYRVIM